MLQVLQTTCRKCATPAILLSVPCNCFTPRRHSAVRQLSLAHSRTVKNWGPARLRRPTGSWGSLRPRPWGAVRGSGLAAWGPWGRPGLPQATAPEQEPCQSQEGDLTARDGARPGPALDFAGGEWQEAARGRGGEAPGTAPSRPHTPLGRAAAPLTGARAGAEPQAAALEATPTRAAAARVAGQPPRPGRALPAADPAAGRHGGARPRTPPAGRGNSGEALPHAAKLLLGSPGPRAAAGQSPLPASDSRTSRQGEWVPQCPPGPGSAHEPWCPHRHRLPAAPRSPRVERSRAREEAEPLARTATPKWAGTPRAGPGPPRRTEGTRVPAGRERSRPGTSARPGLAPLYLRPAAGANGHWGETTRLGRNPPQGLHGTLPPLGNGLSAAGLTRHGRGTALPKGRAPWGPAASPWLAGAPLAWAHGHSPCLGARASLAIMLPIPLGRRGSRDRAKPHSGCFSTSWKSHERSLRTRATANTTVVGDMAPLLPRGREAPSQGCTYTSALLAWTVPETSPCSPQRQWAFPHPASPQENAPITEATLPQGVPQRQAGQVTQPLCCLKFLSSQTLRLFNNTNTIFMVSLE